MENLIQRGDLNQRLTRALEIKGQKSPILTLDNAIVGVVLVEDLTKQAEWVSPTQRLLASSQAIAAVAAQSGIVVITNPVGSGVIAVVHKITATGGTQWTFGLADPLALPATPANLFFRDRRNTGAPACRAFNGTDGVLRIVNPYLTFQGGSAVASPWYEVEGVVIQPGESFGMQATTQNILVQPTIWLEEIPV
jgi:hypothetical protein